MYKLLHIPTGQYVDISYFHLETLPEITQWIESACRKPITWTSWINDELEIGDKLNENEFEIIEIEDNKDV